MRAELDRLEAEEKAVSKRRSLLHERIDFLRTSVDADHDELEVLLADERAISAERRELHARIDALRVELGLEPGRPRKPRIVE